MSDTIQINVLTDTLTARVGIDGKTFLVLNPEGEAYAWDTSQDPQGRSAVALLVALWIRGMVNLSNWQDATAVVPQFTHDCATCEFLGRVTGADAYLCAGVRGPSLIVRFSSEGPEYCSMPAEMYANANGPQGEAYSLWHKRTERLHRASACKIV